MKTSTSLLAVCLSLTTTGLAVDPPEEAVTRTVQSHDSVFLVAAIPQFPVRGR